MNFTTKITSIKGLTQKKKVFEKILEDLNIFYRLNYYLAAAAITSVASVQVAATPFS